MVVLSVSTLLKHHKNKKQLKIKTIISHYQYMGSGRIGINFS